MADARKSGAVIIYDYEGAPIKRYKFVNGWPKIARDRQPQGR